jgi:hypothetical protein
VVRLDRDAAEPCGGGAGRHRRAAAAATRLHSQRPGHRAPVHGARARLLTEITELRSKAHQQIGERDFAKIAEKFETEARLEQQMGRLLVLSENYPQLRSDGPMIEAQRTYSEVETNLAAARRFYNASVAALRNAAEIRSKRARS